LACGRCVECCGWGVGGDGCLTSATCVSSLLASAPCSSRSCTVYDLALDGRNVTVGLSALGVCSALACDGDITAGTVTCRRLTFERLWAQRAWRGPATASRSTCAADGVGGWVGVTLTGGRWPLPGRAGDGFVSVKRRFANDVTMAETPVLSPPTFAPAEANVRRLASNVWQPNGLDLESA